MTCCCAAREYFPYQWGLSIRRLLRANRQRQSQSIIIIIDLIASRVCLLLLSRNPRNAVISAVGKFINYLGCGPCDLLIITCYLLAMKFIEHLSCSHTGPILTWIKPWSYFSFFFLFTPLVDKLIGQLWATMAIRLSVHSSYLTDSYLQ